VRRLTTLPLSGADGLEIWESKPPETLRACNGPVQGLLYLYTRRCVSRNARDVLHVASPCVSVCLSLSVQM